MSLFCPWEPAKFLLFSSNVPPLLYYSHIPVVIIALVLGFFVWLYHSSTDENAKLTSRLLLVTIVLFSLYSFIDLIIWASNSSDFVMFWWSLIIIVEVLVFASATYMTIVFVRGRNIEFHELLAMFILVTPLVILAPTHLNLSGIDLAYCDADEGIVAGYYSYFLELFFTTWIIYACIHKIFISKGDRATRKKVALWGVGIVVFLFAFSWGNIMGTFTGDWNLAQFGLFGMPVFIAFLTYLIVKFKTFSIKLLATEALVGALWLLILGLLFIQRIEIIKAVTAFTLIIVLLVGIALVRSVRREVEQREKIEILAKDLEKANVRLRELDQLKSEFLSFATHQIRSPLTAIHGYTTMIEEGDFGDVSPEVKKAIGVIGNSSESLIKIVNEFLDISRIEQGRMEYDKTVFDLGSLVKEVAAELEPNIKQKGLEMSVKAAEAKVEADRNKIKQVIANLLDNSVKYTPSGSISIELQSKEGKALLKIADTGIGVDADEISNLFSKFSRTRDASKTSVSGTGLGLYVAKQMIVAHKGRIWVESEGKGKGSTFFVELPLI